VVVINRLEIENIKRVQAVRIEPSPIGLTIIGGRNKQGKTSVLDAILWALGGNKHKPSEPKRNGSSGDPRIEIELDNGVRVIRDGKNASLKVIDQYGNKAGQALLDELIGQLALDLPKFMQASGKEKAEILLKIIGVGDQLTTLDRDAERLYNERHAVGQVLTRKKKHAEDLPFEQGAPEEEVSASELIQQQQAILARNGENQRLRAKRDELRQLVEVQTAAVEDLRRKLADAETQLARAEEQFITASRTAEDLQDESTAELEASLRQIDEVNKKVRRNSEKRAAEAEASEIAEQVDDLTARLELVRSQRQALLDGADLPLPGLSVVGGELAYQSQRWDGMSSADQLRVAVAIIRKLRPDCQFVLLDKLEQMDSETLAEFGAWLEAEKLQVIATRVSTGGECSIIIEDGLVVGAVPATAKPMPPTIAFADEGF